MKITSVTVKHGRYYVIEQLAERKPNGRPRQKWHGLTRVGQGETALLDALAAFKRQTIAPGGNIVKAIEGFLKHWTASAAPTFTVKADYERMFRIIGEKFVEFNVDQVTPGDVLAFLARFADRPTARRAYKARLSTFFSWCVLQQLCRVNPCREIKLKAPPKRKRRIRDAGVWFAIYDRLPPIGQCFADLCFLTTARPTEIRLLDERQITDVIHFQPTKTARSSGATVDWPLTPEIAAVLDRARSLNKRRALPGASAPVIQDRDGAHYAAEALGDMWRAAATAAGHKGVTTRDIRPYALVCAELQGYDLRALQQAAAHTDTSTTQGYLDQYRDVVSTVRMTMPERPR